MELRRNSSCSPAATGREGSTRAFEGEPHPGADSSRRQPDPATSARICRTTKPKTVWRRTLFPLTSEQQKDYDFKLLGQEEQAGRSVYHIGFRPKDKNDITWAGEAYIDAAEFQPVRVFTKLSRRIPFAVRTLLGTDLPGLGFSVVYKRQEDGVWFPATFGTEFRIHALFFINRNVSVSLENTDFQHTHVESRMKVVGPVD